MSFVIGTWCNPSVAMRKAICIHLDEDKPQTLERAQLFLSALDNFLSSVFQLKEITKNAQVIIFFNGAAVKS